LFDRTATERRGSAFVDARARVVGVVGVPSRHRRRARPRGADARARARARATPSAPVTDRRRDRARTDAARRDRAVDRRARERGDASNAHARDGAVADARGAVERGRGRGRDESSR